jgi:signal transduction histidine kinase
MRVRTSVLLAGALSALLVLIAVAALFVWRKTTEMQAHVAELHEAHIHAGNALASIRSNVYASGILTRDYLLDPDPQQVSSYVEQFRQIRAQTQQAFRTLEAPGPDTPRRAALDELKHELSVYWDPTETALRWTTEEKNALRSNFLRQRVRKRQDIFDLANDVERLMTASFNNQRQQVQRTAEDFRAFLAWGTAAALVLAIVIAAWTMLRMLYLERHSRNAEYELRRLSGQLRTAQEDERKYLSRELHDQVGQMLTGLRMELAGLARLQTDEQAASRMNHAKSIVEQTLRMVRNIAMLLRPSMLDDLGVAPAIAWQVKEFERTTGIRAEVEVDDALDSLPDRYRTCLYRVVQEALTNCARHSHARKVRVCIAMQDNVVVASVSDDGAGFDSASTKGHGLGLLGMGERVRELGGRFVITSAPGRGTHVEARIPLPDSQEVNEVHDSNADRGRSRDRSGRLEASA